VWLALMLGASLAAPALCRLLGGRLAGGAVQGVQERYPKLVATLVPMPVGFVPAVVREPPPASAHATLRAVEDARPAGCEDAWLREGLARYRAWEEQGQAAAISATLLVRQTDRQLTAWPARTEERAGHDDAAALFALYLAEQTDVQAVRRLEQEPSVAGLDAALATANPPRTRQDLFGAWVAANYLDAHGGAGQYQYRTLAMPALQPQARYGAHDMPASSIAVVEQYGADYILLNGVRPVTLSFTGTTQTYIAPIEAHSGAYTWWSHRADNCRTTLARRFDLRQAEEATLSFWTWHDLAVGDTAALWVTTPDAPATRLYTATGVSERWRQERVDLSAFAGQVVSVTFVYETDDAVTGHGFLFDDVAVEAVGYHATFEQDGGGWTAAGFVRQENTLPQAWLVQLLWPGSPARVDALPLAADQRGTWRVPLSVEQPQAVVVVAALSPSHLAAAYMYALTP
jgi:hypothetical protein